MKISIGEKEIELLPIKGRVVKKARKMMIEIAVLPTEKEQALATNAYFDYIDEQAAEIAGMTVDELDDLDENDKAKITKTIIKKVDSQLDFLRSSSPQQS